MTDFFYDFRPRHEIAGKGMETCLSFPVFHYYEPRLGLEARFIWADCDYFLTIFIANRST